MRSATKNLVTVGVYTALLLGGQFVLSGVAGVEVVTVLLLAFCYVNGVRQGMLTANAFTLLRCFIFGFMPNVLLLYFVYYNLFAVVFGLVGKAFGREYGAVKHAALVPIAVAMTALFTVTDNILTPLMYGFSSAATKGYWAASLYTLVPQLLCTLFTVLLLFPPLYKLLKANAAR